MKGFGWRVSGASHERRPQPAGQRVVREWIVQHRHFAVSILVVDVLLITAHAAHVLHERGVSWAPVMQRWHFDEPLGPVAVWRAALMIACGVLILTIRRSIGQRAVAAWLFGFGVLALAGLVRPQDSVSPQWLGDAVIGVIVGGCAIEGARRCMPGQSVLARAVASTILAILVIGVVLDLAHELAQPSSNLEPILGFVEGVGDIGLATFAVFVVSAQRALALSEYGR